MTTTETALLCYVQAEPETELYAIRAAIRELTQAIAQADQEIWGLQSRLDKSFDADLVAEINQAEQGRDALEDQKAALRERSRAVLVGMLKQGG